MRTYTHGVIGYLLYAKRLPHEQRLAIIGSILPEVFLALGFVPHYLEHVTHSAMAAAFHNLLHHSVLHTVTVSLHSFVIVDPCLTLSCVHCSSPGRLRPTVARSCLPPVSGRGRQPRRRQG